MGLTKQFIDKIGYCGDGKKWDIRWDGEVPGFGVRVYPSNKKSFVLFYRSTGRQHLMVLGQYGVMTLDEARKQAKIKIGQINQGMNPLVKKRSLVKLGTVSELCEVYLERHSKVHKKSWEEDQRRIETKINPSIGRLPVASLTVADVAQMHLKLGQSSIYEANRTVELLRGILEKGRIWEFLPMEALNPAKGVKRFKEKRRDRWLTHEELPRVARAIAEESNIYIKAAIWLYLLTGLRKTELLKAKWTDVDFARGELRLLNTKSGNDHYVPLSTAAIEILRGLPKLEGNPYVIPGAKSGKALVNISKPWYRVREKAGVEDVRLHDLRRTLGSWLAQNGASLHLIGKVLNHASSETTKIYARFGQDSVREALEEHGTRLLTSVRGPNP